MEDTKTRGRWKRGERAVCIMLVLRNKTGPTRRRLAMIRPNLALTALVQFCSPLPCSWDLCGARARSSSYQIDVVLILPGVLHLPCVYLMGRPSQLFTLNEVPSLRAKGYHCCSRALRASHEGEGICYPRVFDEFDSGVYCFGISVYDPI